MAVEVRDASSLRIANSTVSANTAGSDGGGVFAKAFTDPSNLFPNPRAITISRSVISGNTAMKRGGGLYAFNFEGTETLVEETRVTGNHVPNTYAGGNQGNGGGIYAYLWGNSSGAINVPKWTITRSTVDNNDAEHEGGGIFVCGKYFGYFIATNSTLSTNRTTNESTGMGGGIFIARFPFGSNESIDAYLHNVTATQNVSAVGGGVGMADLDNVRVRIANSIVSQNLDHQGAPNNLDGRVMVANFKHNLVGTGSTILDHLTAQVVYQDQPFVNIIPAGNNNIMGPAANTPGLEPLTNNGGLTPTHRLMNNSPAIDKGSDALASDPLSGQALNTDQRGGGPLETPPTFPRIFDIATVGNGPGGAVDIGAYEIGLPKVIDVIIRDSIGSYSHPAYSFASVVGDGDQLRTVPVGSANRIEIRFSEVVTLNPVDVKVQSARHPTFFYPGTVTHSGSVTVWTRNTGAISADQIILTVDDAVSGLGGFLDGNWDNPSSLNTPTSDTFPSGDGAEGGDFTFRITILSGDFTHDNIVNSLDYVVWAKFQQTLSGAGHWQGDADGDGDVDLTDYYSFWWSQFGTNFTQWPS